MQYLQVKNWSEFQHYKSGRHASSPTWIKLYLRLLHDPEFSVLPDASKAHLVMLWLLAPSLDNRIPWDVEWVSRQISATEKVDLELLIRTGFLRPLSECLDTQSRQVSSHTGLLFSGTDLDLPEESENVEEEEDFFPNAREILNKRRAAQKSESQVPAVLGKPLVAIASANGAAGMSSSQAIVAAAVEVAEAHGVVVTKRDRGTWAGVAKRVAAEREPEQVAAAIFGMTRFNGQGWKFHQDNPDRSPWNPFDLEKFFTKAAAAGVSALNGGGPAATYDLERATMIRTLARYSNGNGRH